MTLRLLATGLVLSLLAPLSVVPAFAQEASTIPTLKDAVAYLSEHSIPDVDRENDVLTRGEAIVLAGHLDRNLLIKAQVRMDSTQAAFSDVSVTSPLSAFGSVALEEGLVVRNIDRTLRPKTPIRAEEAIALLAGAKHTTEKGWFVPSVRDALLKNAVADARSMSVGGQITRGEFFDIAYRLAVVKDRNLIAFDPSEAKAPAAAAVIAAAPVRDVTLPTIFAAAPSDAETAMRYGSGKPFAITIPTLGIEGLTITHPEDSVSRDGLLSVLDEGVGHLYSYPGRGAKIMIYGHSSDYAWVNTPYTEIFSNINQLTAGDKVYVSRDGTTYTYVVTGQDVISPDDTTPFEGDGEELILYTCWPPKSTAHRLIVRASPEATVAVR